MPGRRNQPRNEGNFHLVKPVFVPDLYKEPDKPRKRGNSDPVDVSVVAIPQIAITEAGGLLWVLLFHCMV